MVPSLRLYPLLPLLTVIAVIFWPHSGLKTADSFLLIPSLSQRALSRENSWYTTTLSSITGDADNEIRQGGASLGDPKRRGLFNGVLVPFLSLVETTTAATIADASSERTGTRATARTEEEEGETITVPLRYIPKLSAYVVYFQVGGERFGAVLDSGSPFLMVPSYCDRRAWGCYQPESSRPSGLSSTYEHFDNNEGEVEWRTAPFAFVNATGSMVGPQEMVFGVLSESLMTGPGGVFFGLIRDTDSWIRPSFLGQTNVKAFDIDLRGKEEASNAIHLGVGQQKSLTLYTSNHPRLSARSGLGNDYIPLVTDLNRKYGDPVIHYTARASSLYANGKSVLASRDKTPIYVIFDTGVSGMVVDRELLEQRYATARQNREKSLWGTVEVRFRTQQKKDVALVAHKPVTTPLGGRPWPKFNNAHLIVVGLAFLDGHKISIDIEEKKLQFQS